MLLQQFVVGEALVTSSAHELTLEVEVSNSTSLGPYSHHLIKTFVGLVLVRMRIKSVSYVLDTLITLNTVINAFSFSAQLGYLTRR